MTTQRNADGDTRDDDPRRTVRCPHIVEGRVCDAPMSARQYKLHGMCDHCVGIEAGDYEHE